jgi:monoamine oxidase
MALTRRMLIGAMARLGGTGAAYETLAAWNFLRPPAATAANLGLPEDSGKGRSVVILGAGVAGLTAAFELDQAGYDCVVLEAAPRIGGRSLTLRRGDVLREIDGPPQQCAFDDGLWLNAGPGRIPHHHVQVIDYCRRFGVALQPYIFASRANLVHSGFVGNGRTMPVRRALYDLQGHVAELLDKCVEKGGLDLPVTGRDLEALREMLANFGDLTKVESAGRTTYSYRNKSGRAGFDVEPGLANAPGKPLSPLALDELLRSQVWNDFIFREAEYYWQASLLEPVGGMDRFVKAFARQPLRGRAGTIENLIRLGARVSAIDVGGDKVTVAYADGGAAPTGTAPTGARTVTADYCICTIPAPIFGALRANLPATYMEAARKLPVQAAGKVGWQADRFWETKDQIFGGISWTTDVITQIWYPSSDFLSRKGVLTGAYMYGEPAERFNALPIAERLRIAKEQGEKLHVDYGRMVEHGLAIGWNRMEFARFGWADESDPAFAVHAPVLARPQGRFHMAGDQITYWSGWQEGAIISAFAAVRAIDRQVNPTATRRG